MKINSQLRRAVLCSLGLLAAMCSPKNGTNDSAAAVAEIERILKIQDDAYDANTEESRKILASTCLDSLMFVGGDNGGLATSADYYVHDLADGYSQRPHDRTFRVLGNTVIVSSLQQSYKVFHHDTIYFNSRSSKVFVKVGDDWKMVFVTYAPLPVSYENILPHDPKRFKEFAGLYESGPESVDTITVNNDGVYISSLGSPRAELKPVNDSTFVGDGYVGKTVFSRDSKGVVTESYFLFPDGQAIHFKKLR